MSLAVVTSITDKYDRLQETPGGARYVCYTDSYTGSNHWEIRPAYNYFRDARLNSRIYKILAHKFVDSEYIIWIDGSIKLKEKPENLIKHLEDKDVAFMVHPFRNEADPFTVYAEIQLARDRNSADKLLLQQQEDAYRMAGVPEEQIYTGGLIIRKNTPEMNKLFEEWWAEYCQYPTRDQISLFKVFHGKANIINEDLNKNDLIELCEHN